MTMFSDTEFNLIFDFKELAPYYKKDLPMVHLGKLAENEFRLVTKEEFEQACEDRLNDGEPFEYSATGAEFAGA